MTEKLLEINDLKTYFYSDEGIVKAVDGVNITINKGETVGIVGESGCGKSVTSLSVMRLLHDTPGKVVGGSIMFEGKNLLELSEKEMRKIRGNDISMIFQEPMTSLNPVFKIGDQLEEAVQLHLSFLADTLNIRFRVYCTTGHDCHGDGLLSKIIDCG